MTPMPDLTPARRRSLRARAHKLDPVMYIGKSGLTTAVIAEIDRSLRAHELIKVRVNGAGRDDREAMLEEICGKAGAQPVQHIGKILVLFRENPEPSPRLKKPTRTAPQEPRTSSLRRGSALRPDPRRTCR